MPTLSTLEELLKQMSLTGEERVPPGDIIAIQALRPKAWERISQAETPVPGRSNALFKAVKIQLYYRITCFLIS